MDIIGYFVVLCLGVYIGKYHYDTFLTTVKNVWEKFKSLFKK